jgi:prevent-host-death family protein
MEVGVRELKSRLSEYLSRVTEGEPVVVTDRGRPVARLVPYTADSAIDRGVDEGWIEAPRRTSMAKFVPIRSKRSVLEVLDEDRG